jgi:hypothetical protein
VRQKGRSENEATGRSDIEGKTVRVTASAAGVSEFQLSVNPPSPERYGVTQDAERMTEKGGIKKGKTHKTATR